MSNRNKLAFKGTPGPWKHKIVVDTHCVLADNNKEWTICDCGLSIRVSEPQREANAHLISAAPEAVEFISDLLTELAYAGAIDYKKMEARAEEILKKAYNF